MTRPRSPEDDEKLRQLVFKWRKVDGESWASIADSLQVSLKTVQTWATKWGLSDPIRSQNVRKGQRMRAERLGGSQCST